MPPYFRKSSAYLFKISLIFMLLLHLQMALAYAVGALSEDSSIRIAVFCIFGLLNLAIGFFLLLIFNEEGRGNNGILMLFLALLHLPLLWVFTDYWNRLNAHQESISGRLPHLLSEDIEERRVPEMGKNFLLTGVRLDEKLEMRKTRSFRERSRQKDSNGEAIYEEREVEFRLIPLYALRYAPDKVPQPLAFVCYNERRRSLYPFDTKQIFYLPPKSELTDIYAQLAEEFRITYGFPKPENGAYYCFEQADLQQLQANPPSLWSRYLIFMAIFLVLLLLPKKIG